MLQEKEKKLEEKALDLNWHESHEENRVTSVTSGTKEYLIRNFGYASLCSRCSQLLNVREALE